MPERDFIYKSVTLDLCLKNKNMMTVNIFYEFDACCVGIAKTQVWIRKHQGSKGIYTTRALNVVAEKNWFYTAHTHMSSLRSTE